MHSTILMSRVPPGDASKAIEGVSHFAVNHRVNAGVPVLDVSCNCNELTGGFQTEAHTFTRWR